ncbi:hypothetical protein [Candidatus Tokpelaia sp.]|uniref:hypothetical protein n=1 Tax=Candidatus Tokpelaia sp. TaxID=2233777 RepID=UPI00123B6DE5|nr:hypothetical protein [Candidatus Tokpelaia sp.]KAA6405777.1 hypothetical protein DPQ22_02840 [Candidatus Tokpelaia sp.]
MTKNKVQALDEFADEMLQFETTGTFFTPQEIRILREAILGTVQILRQQAGDLALTRGQLDRALARLDAALPLPAKRTVAQMQASLLSENVVLFPIVARPVLAAE